MLNDTMIIMKKLFFYSLFLMMFITACDSPEPNELYFVGDSHVARWDLKQWFAACVTHNEGVSGSGIDYIESRVGEYNGCDVVVVTGTNDLWSMSVAEEDKYVERYITALKGLNAGHIYLFSIFPRGSRYVEGEFTSNERIARLNNKIQAEVALLSGITYIDVFALLLRNGTLHDAYTYDGLHLSIEGYELITNQLKKQL